MSKTPWRTVNTIACLLFSLSLSTSLHGVRSGIPLILNLKILYIGGNEPWISSSRQETLISKAPIWRTRGKKWREEITLYLDLATKTDEKERKVKLCLYLIGSKGREIYGTMQFETEEKDRTLDELIQSFGEYCDPKKTRRWRGTSSSQETRNQEKHLISTLQN